MAESLSGTIERVTFHNPENGFAVLRVQANGKRDLITLVAYLANALAGEYIEATGAWVNDREHGLQFKADEAIEVVRTNPYRLATDIWGIGFQTADKLAERLGIDRASPLRARAALRYVLQRLSDEGHVGFPESLVIQRTAELTQIGPEIL